MNYEALYNSICEVLDNYDDYDIETILYSATPCWDDTAIQVKADDFIMIFDDINYELMEYTGDDINV